ncbi:MAG TPA: hypothetical protein VFO49_14415, partial [Nocardioides sp.]|nr:hypothetical protein [Nocardioides sp.]
ALQRGVSAADDANFRREARRAFLAHGALGVVGGAAVVLFGRDVTSVLFGSDLAAPQDAITFLGLAFFAVSLNTSLGRHTLASQGRFTALLAATAAGAGCGVLGILLGAELRGVAGAAAGVALGELVVLLVMGAAVAARSRPHRRTKQRSVA